MYKRFLSIFVLILFTLFIIYLGITLPENEKDIILNYNSFSYTNHDTALSVGDVEFFKNPVFTHFCLYEFWQFPYFWNLMAK